MAMRNMLLDNGGKAILVVMKVAENLAELCLYSSFLWKMTFGDDEMSI